MDLLELRTLSCETPEHCPQEDSVSESHLARVVHRLWGDVKRGPAQGLHGWQGLQLGGNYLKAVEGTGPGALAGEMTPNQETDQSSEQNPELMQMGQPPEKDMRTFSVFTINRKCEIDK